MKIVVAPNALKGSLDAFAACDAVAAGVKRALPDAMCVNVPVGDGGDGTAAVLSARAGAQLVEVACCDPLGRPISASYGWIEHTRTALLDVASASGLRWLTREERLPALTSSFGTGLLLRAALDRGARRVLLGLGGSATIDAGAGIAEALGARWLDDAGGPIARGAGALGSLSRIDLADSHPALRDAATAGGVELVCLCDVDNPLTGPEGAVAVFAQQKGADAALRTLLAHDIEHVASVWQRDFAIDMRPVRHAGSAGGIAAGLAVMFGARLRAGIDCVLEELDFAENLRGADLVITCEGHVDAQTLKNKAPCGVALAARRADVPVVMLAGGIDPSLAPEQLSAFDAVLSIAPGPIDLADAMARAGELLERAAEQAMRLVLVGARPRVTWL